jgi:5,10-methylenetetrahydromethanopterin reductase
VVQCGFFFWPYTPEYTIRMARLAEEFNYHMVGIADTPGNAMDPWVALTLVASHTRRARVSMCVTNVVTRHPAVTATAIASVDLVSAGRAILGVGAGHSGVINFGGAPASPQTLREAVAFIKALLNGERASYGPATIQLPWLRRRVPVYVAASGPTALRMAGAAADGAFVNYGLQSQLVAQTEALIQNGAEGTGRNGSNLEVWYIACLDCSESRDAALEKLGSILGFVAAYIVGRNPERRGVPPELVPAVRELCATYSTRRGEMDPGLVRRLGLFDYLRGRLAVAGTPDDCIEQVRAAQQAGVRRLMFTVSLAADPVRTIELFGRHVLPAVSA